MCLVGVPLYLAGIHSGNENTVLLESLCIILTKRVGSYTVSQVGSPNTQTYAERLGILAR